MDRAKKYRAWHPELKKMYYASMDDLLYGLGSQGAGSWTLEEEIGEDLACFAGWYSDEEKLYHLSHEMVYMEPIGLSDKTGEEVYEGDIVELNCLGHGGPYKKRARVIWADFRWWFQTLEPDAYGCIEAIWVERKWQSECEIVGNIHEHPHLLPQQCKK